MKFLLVACEIWTPVGIRTPDNNWDLESTPWNPESTVSKTVLGCSPFVRTQASQTIAGLVSYQMKSNFSKRFLLKNHLLCVYYLGFD